MRHVNFGTRQLSKLVDSKRKVPCFHSAGTLSVSHSSLPVSLHSLNSVLESAMKDHVPSEQAKTSRRGGSSVFDSSLSPAERLLFVGKT